MIRLETEIEFEGQDDIPVIVEAHCHPGSPGARTLSNGDPGYPPDPAEVEIGKVVLASDKTDITDRLSPETIRTLEDRVAEEADARAEAGPDPDGDD
jgi:hypothetical protein